MKKIIKKVYMIFFHPKISLYNLKKNIFIRRKSNIKNINRIIFGNEVNIGYDCRINFFSKMSKLYIEDGVYIGHRVSLILGENITIRKNTIIASDVCIVSENHGIDPEINIPYKNQELILKPVVIGEGCWIGEKAIILPGVEIGDKCVIGAGSVVTKSVSNNTVVAGNPAKAIKYYDYCEHKWVKK